MVCSYLGTIFFDISCKTILWNVQEKKLCRNFCQVAKSATHFPLFHVLEVMYLTAARQHLYSFSAWELYFPFDLSS